MNRTSRIISCIGLLDRSRSEVSHWTVGQHVLHVLMSANGIIDSLHASPRGQGRERLSLLKFASLTFSHIPRGKAKAPDVVRPQDVVTEHMVRDAYSAFQQRLPGIKDIAKDHWFRHPVFGDLLRDNALRFIEVHSHHHSKIIKDIVS